MPPLPRLCRLRPPGLPLPRRRGAIGISLVVHAAALALFLNSGPDRADTPREVLLEFETGPAPEEPVAAPAPAPAEGAVREQEETGDPGRASPRREHAPEPSRARRLQALLASDFDNLRSGVRLAGIAGISSSNAPAAEEGPAEPDIHLSQGEIDALVAEGHGYDDHGTGRGARGRGRRPPVCLPPLR